MSLAQKSINSHRPYSGKRSFRKNYTKGNKFITEKGKINIKIYNYKRRNSYHSNQSSRNPKLLG